MTEFLSVFVTAASSEEAQTIARAAVEEKLAACGNIFPGVQSIYRWQNKIEETQECAVILKTSADKFEALQARVKELHSYENPCIVAWPIVAGNKDYLNWLNANLR